MKKIYFSLTCLTILFTPLQKSFSQNVCSDNIIYVDSNLITANNSTIEEWKKNNPRMVLCNTIGSEISVDLGKFQNEDDIPIWLKENSIYIDFKKSFSLIEKIHLLDKTEYREIINKAEIEILNRDFFGITYDELKFFFNKDINTIPQADYYKNHKRIIDKNIFHNVLLRDKESFDKNYSSFSAPFFMSVIAKNNILPENYKNCYLVFTYIDNDTKAIMKFTYDGVSSYYNFSDEPTTSKIVEDKPKKEILKKYL